MKKKDSAEWAMLDNAAKIFPPTSSRRDPKVFRFACELYDPVEKEPLEKALKKTLDAFPLFRSVMHKGLFWYYLEESPLLPEVHEESGLPCAPLYDRNKCSLLFRVTYFRKRINLEVYHALTDGTGALQFLRVLVYQYILLRHPKAFPGEPPQLNYDASFAQKSSDSFQKYYTGAPRQKRAAAPKAYRLSGLRTPDAQLRIIEGVASVKEVLEKAHDYNTTMTVLLTALLLQAIHGEMAVRHERQPVVLMVPVNLRNYFDSESARNFFGIIEVGYDFRQGCGLPAILESVRQTFARELTPERLARRMNKLSSLEHNAAARVVPLVLKNPIMRLAGRISERSSTSTLSNVGRIDMPAGFEAYIRNFDVFITTEKLQLCLCSYGDNLTMTFTSSFTSTDVQRRFFRSLTQMGVSVEISSNLLEGEVPRHADL